MKPIPRKELYLNKIVGNDDYDIPEKPIIEEEFFFAEILGEAVRAPEPLPRYQIYLAKIAGREIEIPYPEVRLEYFLARAAGMDVEAPTPITREEIYWSNYTVIVEFELEGIPPLSFNAKAGALGDYRIYGNTVDGESVGNVVTEGEHTGEYVVPVTVEGKNLINSSLESYTTSSGITVRVNSDKSITLNTENETATNTYIYLYRNNTIPESLLNKPVILSGGASNASVRWWHYDGTNIIESANSDSNIFTATQGAIDIFVPKNTVLNNLTVYPMIRKADIEDDTYEPYRTPVTTPIYLPEPIKMVGDEAEYISYADQKLHRIGAEDIDVTLSALPTLTGTNVLTVGTAVQPSKIYIKGRKKRE